MRRLPLVLAVFVLTLPWLGSGCSRRATPAEEGVRTHTLLLGNGNEPADLDPPAATAYTDMNIINALFEGLTFIDEQTTRPVPAAAETWQPSSDGLTWTFHLRPNAAWSNGDPVTADDFVQSFRRAVSPRMAFENASYLFALKNAEAINSGKVPDPGVLGATAPDPHTLVLTLERPTPHLPLLTALTPWYPINPRVLQKFDAMKSRGTPWTRPGNLVGNGAFVLTAWTPNAQLVVTKNPQYWDAAHTGLERIIFFPIENPQAEELSFRAGQLHVTNAIPITKIAAWRAHNPAELRVDPFLQTTFIEFNTKQPPFDDPRVRRAFALAIDREAISRAALGGSYAPAPSATPPHTGGYTPRAQVGHDPAQAQALLTEAGHPHGTGIPTLTLQVRNDELQPSVAEALQAMWRQTLGVRVDITPFEQKTWLQNQKTLNYTLSTFTWVADYPDPLTFLGLFTSDNGNNWTGWRNAQYDALIHAAATMNEAADRQGGRPGRLPPPAPSGRPTPLADGAPPNRLETFQRAEALLLDQSPVTPVYYGAQAYLIQPAVHDWDPALLGSRRYQRVRLGP